MSTKKTKAPYTERRDDEKLESNWKKARGLFGRKDYSAAIMRAATSAEIAANIYVRRFLLDEFNLPEDFVDALLYSANGLDGKFKRLIKPAAECRGTWKDLKSLQRTIVALHDHRNSIAHAGYFKDKSEAKQAFENALEIIQKLCPNEAAKLKPPHEI
jgi:hypothetical protein